MDGIKRNFNKLRSEWRYVNRVMGPHWERFFRHPDSHAYVNLFVEARRASPYLFGHIDAVLYPCLLVAFAYVIW